MIGNAELNTNISTSLYSQLTASTQKIWGKYVYQMSYNSSSYTWEITKIPQNTDKRLAAVIAEEWEAQDTSVKDYLVKVYLEGENDNFSTWPIDQIYTSVVSDGLANDYFASAYDLANAKEELENKDLWSAFALDLTKTDEANKSAMNEYNTEYAKLQTQLSDLDYTYQQETAELNRTKDGYEELGTIMKGVINKANNSDNFDIEPALEALKNKIIDIEGGLKVTTIEGKESTEYVVGSIAENEAWINYYTNINTLIDEGKYDFESGLEQQIALKNSEIDAKKTEIEVLTKLVEQANEKKDALLKGLTGESSTTTPAE